MLNFLNEGLSGKEGAERHEEVYRTFQYFWLSYRDRQSKAFCLYVDSSTLKRRADWIIDRVIWDLTFNNVESQRQWMQSGKMCRFKRKESILIPLRFKSFLKYLQHDYGKHLDWDAREIYGKVFSYFEIKKAFKGLILTDPQLNLCLEYRWRNPDWSLNEVARNFNRRVDPSTAKRNFRRGCNIVINRLVNGDMIIPMPAIDAQHEGVLIPA